MGIFALFCIALSVASAANTLSLDLYTPRGKVHNVGAPEAEWCNVCVSFMDQAIGELLNIIANGGVIGGCGDLCGQLPNQVEATVCDLLCDYVGIEAFIKLIQVDPDPIYICEELDACPSSDSARARGLSFTANPKSAAVGATIELTFAFQILNQTGTGQVLIQITPPGGMSMSGGELIVGLKPGSYAVRMQLSTQPSQQQNFPAGQYQCQGFVCEGTCGSSHPHSYTMATLNTTFTLTQ